MTRPRPSRAERLRLAAQQRAEAEERQMVMIERDLSAIEGLTRTALMTRIAYNKGKIPKARCEAIVARLTRELDAMRVARGTRHPVPDAKPYGVRDALRAPHPDELTRAAHKPSSS